MKSFRELWDLVEGVAGDEGLALFDLDISGGQNRRLIRVFISGPDRNSPAITVEACAKVSKRLTHLLDVEGEGLGDYLLEVSSPGINRRLRLPRHFEGAVGERVRVAVADGRKKALIVRGVLTGFDGADLQIMNEESQEQQRIPLSEVERANVEFLF